MSDADLVEDLTSLCEEYGLLAVYAFGSRAAEIAALVSGGSPASEHPTSDVDVGIEPLRGHELSAKDRVCLMQRLETLFGVARVDLILLPEASAFLAADTVRGELLAATDLDAEARMQLYYLDCAADLVPFLRESWRTTVGTDL